MAYDARVIEVMIASPSDVVEERKIVRDTIARWNAVNSRRQQVCLMATGWDTHSSPELAGRPQDIINERILEHADLLVGIFWTRVGSATGKSVSGSVEEIERHLEAGKPVLLYFSTVPIVPSALDQDQFAALEEFKCWAMSKGLIQTFESTEDFREKFWVQLQITLNDNEYLRDLTDLTIIDDYSAKILAPTNVSDDAKALLSAAASDRNGMIMLRRYLGGSMVSAGGHQFANPNDRRSVARWVAAAEELERRGLTRDINGKSEIFEVNHAGFQLAETLPPFQADGGNGSGDGG